MERLLTKTADGDVWSQARAEWALGVCALFLALVVAGFFTGTFPPTPLQAIGLSLLMAASVASVLSRLREAQSPARLLRRPIHDDALTAANWWRARRDVALGTLLIVNAHAFVQLAGPLGGQIHPLVYGLLAILATFHSRIVGLSLIATAIAIEVACQIAGHPPGGEAAGWAGMVLRCGLIGLFGILYGAVTRWEIRRGRTVQLAAIDREEHARLEAAQDYRLRATGGPEGAPIDREEAEAMLITDAAAAIEEDILATLRLLRASLGCHSAVLLWREEGELRFKVRAADAHERSKLVTTLQPGEGALAGILRRREPVALQDMAPDYEGLTYYARPDLVATRAFLGVPIEERGELVGILCLDRTVSVPFVEVGLDAALQAAEAIVRTIQTERLFLTMEKARYELGRFYDSSRLLNGTLTPAEVHEVALSCTREICRFDFAAIVLSPRTEGPLTHRIVRVEASGPKIARWAETLEGFEFTHNSGLVSMAVEMQVPLPYSGAYRPAQNVVFTRKLPLEGMRSLLILPWVVHGEPLGALVLACKEEGAFEGRRELLEVVSNQVAISLQNAHMYEAMELMATIDGLTGLNNRRTMQVRLDEVLARSQRSGTPFSVIITDIDHFKSINDTYGHPVGDEVLRQVSATFQGLLRQTDIPARYGGEEFVVILEGTELDGALLIAERLRMEIEALKFDGGDDRIFSITMSFGISECPHDAVDPAGLIDTADQALYYAKTHGRNQVRAWRDVRRAADFGTAAAH